MVLVNPAAGGGRTGGLWGRLRPAADALAAIRVVTPESADASRLAVRDAVAAGCDRVVAVGGDGTTHLVVNALLDAEAAGVTLGILPTGTGSDLARSLAIPRDPRAALRRALLGTPVAVDAGRCAGPAGSFAFVNIASAGISGVVDEAVNARPERGRTAFLRATLATLRRYTCVRVRVWVDGAPFFEGPLFLLAVANGTTFGKGMRIAPSAVIDDGLFDVVAVARIPGPELVLRLPQVYLGRHMHAGPVSWRRAREVRLEPLELMPPFDVDGETYRSGPATFTVLPGALRVAGPVADGA